MPRAPTLRIGRICRDFSCRTRESPWVVRRAGRGTSGRLVVVEAAARLLDDEPRLRGDRPGDVEIVRAGLLDRLVDLPELLGRPVAGEGDGLLEQLVAGRDRLVDAKEAAQVD